MNECALNSSCKNTHTITAIMKDGGKQIRKGSPTGGLLRETNKYHKDYPSKSQDVKKIKLRSF